jgi:hypothetical protein
MGTTAFIKMIDSLIFQAPWYVVKQSLNPSCVLKGGIYLPGLSLALNVLPLILFMSNQTRALTVISTDRF